jgi:DNA-binding NtrC family response regulator
MASRGSDHSADTVRADVRGDADAGSVLVVGRSFVSAFPLPLTGAVVIGRGSDADLLINDPSVSRRHARLQVGEPITVTDLGSANGTRVGAEALVPGVAAPLQSGDVAWLGTVMVIMRPRPIAGGARNLVSREDFDRHLAANCVAAGRRGVPFAVLRLVTDAHATGVGETIVKQLRPTDLVAASSAQDHVVLLVDIAPSEASVIGERIRELLAARARNVRIALACHPVDGTAPTELLATLDAQLAGPGPEAGIVVADPRMQELQEMVDRVAASPISVLLLGETGVGKEVFAERIHERSDRAAQPLLRLNCAALSETLLEAELFGHEKGAFTGATATKPGLLETATGGTVFLDEIGDLPLALQAKLLRVLEDNQVRRVGGLQLRAIDVRIIAATHRDLEVEAAQGRFRSDLYYRLNGISLLIPPLRERKSEIEPLARTFLDRAVRRAKRPSLELPAETLRALVAYGWPGNVRELKNTIERAVLLCASDAIGLRHLPERILAAPARLADAAETTLPPPTAAFSAETTLRFRMDEYDREVIVAALAECKGNQTRAARKLGIARSTLVKRIEKYGLPRPRKDDDDSDSGDSGDSGDSEDP